MLQHPFVYKFCTPSLFAIPKDIRKIKISTWETVETFISR